MFVKLYLDVFKFVEIVVFLVIFLINFLFGNGICKIIIFLDNVLGNDNLDDLMIKVLLNIFFILIILKRLLIICGDCKKKLKFFSIKNFDLFLFLKCFNIIIGLVIFFIFLLLLIKLIELFYFFYFVISFVEIIFIRFCSFCYLCVII